MLIRQGDRVKKTADRKRRPAPNYQQGQRVWLSAKDLNRKVPSKKLAPRFVGPFPITKIVGPAAVRLRLPRSLPGDVSCESSQAGQGKQDGALSSPVCVTKVFRPLTCTEALFHSLAIVSVKYCQVLFSVLCLFG